MGAGPDIRSSLTDEDIDQAVAAIQRALETTPNGVVTEWSSASTGNGGAITPTRAFVSDSGHFCREYHEATVLRSGVEATQRGTACRGETGVWRWTSGTRT